ncbi:MULTISPECIES: DUF1254 domain-containing protein [unclassified Phenylobacterium]|uniref:DUF1254 domain-containing protein n=1 Tax=unclassified Phenylobacterium TaxID=2640670 RepID=UPI00083A7346|nr:MULTISPECIES: DUF1254 domain-containing protein [unclassified Phenylobacterium]
MIARWAAASTLLLAFAGTAAAAERAYPLQPAPSYPLQAVDQFAPTPAGDVVPRDPAARSQLARALAVEAAIYGLPSVYQYREMFAQAVDQANPRYVGFNRFAHDRDLAGPDYKAFKSPNSDTLYSNAWLDLTAGPVLIETPDVPLKYYTLNFLDMFSNASNIGTRTFGSKAGRYLIAPAVWTGEPPPGVTLFRVATPRAWILMRVFAQTPAEVAIARKVQDSVRIAPLAPAAKAAAYPRPDADTAEGFFRVLDHVLRTDGHPEQEDALVYRFRAIGIGGPEAFDPARLDAETRAGMEAGFQDAMKMIAASRAQLGAPTGTGWSRVEKARYGFNYLSRATVNYVGLGANVDAENLSFNTFADGQGRPLDGSKGNYTLSFKPPPVNAFWSVTLYDAATLALYPNELGRYLINDRTPGLRTNKDGSIDLRIQHAKPSSKANWLPAPDRPFYLVVRSYLPKPEMISGGWRPPPVVMLEAEGSR